MRNLPLLSERGLAPLAAWTFLAGAGTKRLLAEHHKQMRWFRHPYLETGFPEAEKRQIDAWLAKNGYRIAPVTIDADDWEWAEPYDDAIARHDEARRLRKKAQYLEYTGRTMDWYRSAAHALFGRNISYVMLLHVHPIECRLH